jgi:tripartite-type tricarboxylate transporter receptor subunit TctC
MIKKIFKTLLIAVMMWTGAAWSKTVELVVPWAAGGTTDKVAQVILTHSKSEFTKHGMTLNVSYRAGAGGLLGANSVAASESNKLQILMATNFVVSTPIINPGIATYDVTRDFSMLAYVGHIPMVTVVNSSSGIKNIQDWKASCKLRTLNYGTAGAGSNTHVSSALMSAMMGCNAVAVPYKGAAPAVTDLLGGHIDYLSDYVAGVMPHIESGRFNVLMVLDKTKLSQFPSVPTMADLGYQEYNFYNWFALIANATANPADIAIAQKIFFQVLNSAEAASQLTELGVRGRRTVPPDFLTQEKRNFLQILQRVNIK